MAAPASASHANLPFLVQAEANGLAPGAYIWNLSVAPSGPMSMVIDLKSQRAAVYRNGMLIGISTIASGKPGYETPDGIFTVLEKQKIHHSNKYDDAPMPYMQRLSWDGLALHGGHPHGYPASHGCIRLPMGFAAALYKEDTRGMEVVITGHAPGREQTMMGQKALTNTQWDDLQAAKLLGGQGEPNATPEQPCCAPAVPESTGNGEANDQVGGPVNGDVNYKADQLQDNERSDGQDRQDDLERSRDVLPPPPG